MGDWLSDWIKEADKSRRNRPYKMLVSADMHDLINAELRRDVAERNRISEKITNKANPGATELAE